MLANISESLAIHAGASVLVRWVVEKADGTLYTDFTGVEMMFFLFEGSPVGGTLAVKKAAAIMTKTTAAGDISLATVPNADMQLVSADTSDIGTGTFNYQLWRSDVDNERCLAFGTFPILP